jgi:transketolase
MKKETDTPYEAAELQVTAQELKIDVIKTLHTLRDINNSLQGHPCMSKTPGIDFSTGALGHGLSVGLGMSLASERSPVRFWQRRSSGRPAWSSLSISIRYSWTG